MRLSFFLFPKFRNDSREDRLAGGSEIQEHVELSNRRHFSTPEYYLTGLQLPRHQPSRKREQPRLSPPFSLLFVEALALPRGWSQRD